MADTTQRSLNEMISDLLITYPKIKHFEIISFDGKKVRLKYYRYQSGSDDYKEGVESFIVHPEESPPGSGKIGVLKQVV